MPMTNPGDSNRSQLCPRCVRYRTRVAGQSGDPVIVRYECESCGWVFSRPLDDPPPLAPAAARTPTPVLAPAAWVVPAPTSEKAQIPPHTPGTTGPEMAVMAVIGIFVVAVLVLAPHSSPRVVSAAVNTEPEALAPPAQVAVAVAEDARPAPLVVPVPVAARDGAHVSRTIVEKPKPAPVAATTRPPADAVPSPPPAVAATSGVGELNPKNVASEPSTRASATKSTATPEAVRPVTVTITGCLETIVDEDRFRLTDIEGADAPKARSWRSGFLTKRSAPVELVALSNPLEVRKYVGRRVVATGLLTSRELRVRSLQSAGA